MDKITSSEKMHISTWKDKIAKTLQACWLSIAIILWNWISPVQAWTSFQENMLSEMENFLIQSQWGILAVIEKKYSNLSSWEKERQMYKFYTMQQSIVQLFQPNIEKYGVMKFRMQLDMEWKLSLWSMLKNYFSSLLDERYGDCFWIMIQDEKEYLWYYVEISFLKKDNTYLIQDIFITHSEKKSEK